jgi:hypothetical protein
LVEMHSVSPSLKQQVRNFVHNHRNRYMSLALGYALKLKMNALVRVRVNPNVLSREHPCFLTSVRNTGEAS